MHTYKEMSSRLVVVITRGYKNMLGQTLKYVRLHGVYISGDYELSVCRTFINIFRYNDWDITT